MLECENIMEKYSVLKRMSLEIKSGLAAGKNSLIR